MTCPLPKKYVHYAVKSTPSAQLLRISSVWRLESSRTRRWGTYREVPPRTNTERRLKPLRCLQTLLDEVRGGVRLARRIDERLAEYCGNFEGPHFEISRKLGWLLHARCTRSPLATELLQGIQRRVEAAESRCFVIPLTELLFAVRSSTCVICSVVLVDSLRRRGAESSIHFEKIFPDLTCQTSLVSR